MHQRLSSLGRASWDRGLSPYGPKHQGPLILLPSSMPVKFLMFLSAVTTIVTLHYHILLPFIYSISYTLLMRVRFTFLDSWQMLTVHNGAPPGSPKKVTMGPL